MAGGKARPKKDKMLKVSAGQLVKTGEILVRGMDTYKAGKNIQGRATLFALCDGLISFSRKKTSRGRVRTFINVLPITKKPKAKE